MSDISKWPSFSKENKALATLLRYYEPVTDQPGDETRKRCGSFVLLGQGGFGKVLRGRNPKVDEVLALKLIWSTRETENGIRQEVAANRRALSNHANVCQLHNHHVLSDAFQLMVMEACSKGELFSLVEEKGAVPEPEVQPLFKGIVAGLVHLHSVGIVHRDLKLENILLSERDGSTIPKIADLGLAHVFERAADGKGWALGPITGFYGTRSYMAPEIASVSALYDGFASDVWSLGVCLFALLAGFFPYDSASSTDWRFDRVRHMQRSRPHESTTHVIYGFYQRTPDALSPAAVQVVDTMLRVNPAARCSLDTLAASGWVAMGATEREVGMGLGALDGDDGSYRGGGMLAGEEEDDDDDNYRSLSALTFAEPLPEGAAPPPFRRQLASLKGGELHVCEAAKNGDIGEP